MKPEPFDVELTIGEFWTAIRVVRDRWVSSIRQGLNPATVYERGWITKFTEEVVGACGEAAVGKAIGEAWGSVDTFHGVADTGGYIEVRATRVPSGHLLLRPRELRSQPGFEKRAFVLVVGEPPVLQVAGWLYGWEITGHDEWLDTGRAPAWWVPQDALHDFRQILAFHRDGAVLWGAGA